MAELLIDLLGRLLVLRDIRHLIRLKYQGDANYLLDHNRCLDGGFVRSSVLHSGPRSGHSSEASSDPRFDPRFGLRFGPRFDPGFDLRSDQRSGHNSGHSSDLHFDHSSGPSSGHHTRGNHQ